MKEQIENILAEFQKLSHTDQVVCFTEVKNILLTQRKEQTEKLINQREELDAYIKTVYSGTDIIANGHPMIAKQG